MIPEHQNETLPPPPNIQRGAEYDLLPPPIITGQMLSIEKGHRFGLDLVLFWSSFGFVLVSIWSQLWSGFGSELGHHLHAYRFGFGSNLDLDW